MNIEQITPIRALVLTAPGGPEMALVRTLERPRPGPGQVAIEVSHCGVNFADLMARRGDYPGLAGWPRVPGLEVSGHVSALGEGIEHLSIGQPVVALVAGGGYAEVAVAAAATTVPIPPDASISLAVAAALPVVISTALLLLQDTARLRPGETILVHSASGGAGAALAQVARFLGSGLRIGTVGSADKVAAGVEAGYDVALVRAGDLAGRVHDATGGRGVDLILNPIGGASLATDLRLLAPGGRLVSFGNASAGPDPGWPAAAELRRDNISIAGFSLGSLARTDPDRVAGTIRAALDLVVSGRLALAVTEVDSLEAAIATQELLADGRGRGKYAIRIGTR